MIENQYISIGMVSNR